MKSLNALLFRATAVVATALAAGCGGGSESATSATAGTAALKAPAAAEQRLQLGATGFATPVVSPQVQAILDADPDEYATLPMLDAPGYEYAGRLRPRSTSELLTSGLSNNLMIGGETTDRNFSTFSNWREYLNPLGVTKVRVQSGWHDIERVSTTPATYDFRKLDEIVDGALAQNVRPFVFLGYGNENPGCVNCGTRGLGGAFPKGAGKERFLQFVHATVERYKDRVTDWQIWNEPTKDLDTYKVLIVETAQRIKSVQPHAKITIGAFLGTHYVFSCLDCDSNRADREYITNALKYFDEHKGPTVPSADVYVGFHPYMSQVDYDENKWDAISMNNFLSLVRSYGYKPRMDENGAPSTLCQVYALCSPTAQWSEPNQAKYNLRRVLGDLARDIETSMFTITDLHYDNAKNTKGLLRTGVWDPNNDTPFNNGDQTVKGKKIAYVAYQNITALFDNRMTAHPGHGCTAPAGYAVHAFEWRADPSAPARTVIAAWKRTRLPTVSLGRTEIAIECTGLSLNKHAAANRTPYYVDMMDGRAYRMPAQSINHNDVEKHTLRLTVPVGDWPALVADPWVVQSSLYQRNLHGR